MPEVFDLRAFSAENRARCISKAGFNHPLNSWSLSEWLTAALGELGEAAGAVKELLRARDGVPGKGKSTEDNLSNLADEIADTVIYLDLLAQSAGFDLASIVRSKFDRTSKKVGFSYTVDTSQRTIDQTAGLLSQRQNTHGNWNDNSAIAQQIKAAMAGGAGTQRMTAMMHEAVDMIAHKLGRIAAGDPSHKDHWDDIAGYARLVSDRLPSP